MAEWLRGAATWCWRAAWVPVAVVLAVVVVFVCLVLLCVLPWGGGGDRVCPQCGTPMNEIRMSDQAETIYYRCEECGYVEG